MPFKGSAHAQSTIGEPPQGTRDSLDRVVRQRRSRPREDLPSRQQRDKLGLGDVRADGLGECIYYVLALNESQDALTVNIL